MLHIGQVWLIFYVNGCISYVFSVLIDINLNVLQHTVVHNITPATSSQWKCCLYYFPYVIITFSLWCDDTYSWEKMELGIYWTSSQQRHYWWHVRQILDLKKCYSLLVSFIKRIFILVVRTLIKKCVTISHPHCMQYLLK